MNKLYAVLYPILWFFMWIFHPWKAVGRENCQRWRTAVR